MLLTHSDKRGGWFLWSSALTSRSFIVQRSDLILVWTALPTMPCSLLPSPPGAGDESGADGSRQLKQQNYWCCGCGFARKMLELEEVVRPQTTVCKFTSNFWDGSIQTPSPKKQRHPRHKRKRVRKGKLNMETRAVQNKMLNFISSTTRRPCSTSCWLKSFC